MKHNGTQGTYQTVPQNVQPDEATEAKKAPSHESVIESEQSAKTSQTPPKELQEDVADDKKKPMSPLRKFCFVLSLLQCVLFIIAFGWLIPCKIPRHLDDHHYIQNWELNFSGEDFVTSIAVTDSQHKPVVVVVGFRLLSNESLFGVRAVNAFDGSSMWETNTDSKPDHIVCNSLDLNSDNEPRCIVTTEKGQMFAINAKDGKKLWNIHQDEESLNIQLISKPVMGSSCHGENAPYIYTSVQDKLGNINFITISSLSGRIDKKYELPECAALPENIMWRVSKVEHELMDPPFELLMTCRNGAGNGIIYTSNADEFCKNVTSVNSNEVFVKLESIDGARFPLHAELLKGNDGDDLAVLTGDRIIVYREDKDEDSQFSLGRGVIFKDFVVGHFTNSSLVNVVVLTSNNLANSNTLLLLDNTTSRLMRSIPVENGTVVSMITVRNAFNSFDTVLLKLVVQKSENEDLQINAANLTSFEVKYLILECFETGTIRVVTKDLISASCNDENCKPDVFQQNTATLADIDNDGTEELIYFSHKILPSMSMPSVTLQLKLLTAKSCNTCHC